MDKEELIKELKRLKESSKDYSSNKSINTGYETAMMDAIDVVKKLALNDVVKSSCGWTCEKCGEAVNGIEVTYEEKHDGCGGNCI